MSGPRLKNAALKRAGAWDLRSLGNGGVGPRSRGPPPGREPRLAGVRGLKAGPILIKGSRRDGPVGFDVALGARVWVSAYARAEGETGPRN